MRFALLLVAFSLVLLVFAAFVPLVWLRDLCIWFSGMNIALAFRSAEIQRYGKGG
jgi:hypothetical protein